MAKYERVALFIDYENFYNSLQKRYAAEQQRSGSAPKIDFIQLVNYISDHYGPLDKRDFLAVANFSHYDTQKGGLNQVATPIHVESFEPRQVRNEKQPSPGKKYVIKDYADMRLAFEIGQHVAGRPADLYILASGDKAFAAVGQALRKAGYPVLFLLPNPDLSALNIKEDFEWMDCMYTQTSQRKAEAEPQSASPEKQSSGSDPIDELCNLISTLRQEFSTPLPITLVKAIFGSEAGHQLIQAGQSQGRIDVWDDSSGITCISRREERMFGRVVPMNTRPGFVARAGLLYQLTRLVETGQVQPSRAQWRRALKEHGQLNVKEAKQLLNTLFEQGILRDGQLDHPDLRLEKVIKFLQSE